MRNIQIINNENLEARQTITEMLSEESVSIKVEGGWIQEPTEQFVAQLGKGVGVELLCPYCLHGKHDRRPQSLSAAIALTSRGRHDRRKQDLPMNSFHRECVEMARKDEDLILKLVSILYNCGGSEKFFYKGIETSDEIMDFVDNEGKIFIDGKVDFEGSAERLLERLSLFSPTACKDMLEGRIDYDPISLNLTRRDSVGFGLDVLL